MNECLFIGISGGSGSGKSYLAEALVEAFPTGVAMPISLDAYYWPKHRFPVHIQGNYDHPEALDVPLLNQHLRLWTQGKTVDMPQYDFTRHDRYPHRLPVAPMPIMVLDSILLFAMPSIIKQLAVSIFVDAPADVRLARRLQRDIRKRGRSVDDVLNHYFATVRPMHEQFVEQGRHQADVLVSSLWPVEKELALVLAHLQQQPKIQHWLD